jgi:hypothetical protein
MMFKKTTLNTNSKVFKVKAMPLNIKEREVNLSSDRSDSLEQKPSSNKTHSYINMSNSKLNNSYTRPFSPRATSSSASIATKCSSESKSDGEYLSDSSENSNFHSFEIKYTQTPKNAAFEDVVYQYYNNFDQKSLIRTPIQNSKSNIQGVEQELAYLTPLNIADTSHDENESCRKKIRRAGRKHKTNKYQNSDQTLKSDKDSEEKYKTEL